MSETGDPTKVLMDEHRVIERVLGCLEVMAERCGRGEALEAEDARDALAFFREYADRWHHGKEETELFVMMEGLGLPKDEGPTAQMRHEHEFGRDRIRAMAEAVETRDRERFVRNARDYIAMLREHIQKEDHCLFPMVGNLFSGDDVAQLRTRFERVEADPSMREARDRCLKTAERLGARYGSTSSPAS